jgi:rubrerythrin
MKKQAKLIISCDGTSAHIKFSNNKESASFKNEEEIIDCLIDSLNKHKITEDEAEKLFDEMNSAFAEKKLFKSDYHSPVGFHRHKCEKCNYIWEHDGSFLCSHNCPNCGKSEYRKYFGGEAPTKLESKK